MRRKSDQLIPIEVSILEAAVALDRQGTRTFHGYALARLLKTETGRRHLTAHGTLYRALHRLERAGLIESFWEDSGLAEQESRPRRRLYRLTALAEPTLAAEHARLRAARTPRTLREDAEAT